MTHYQKDFHETIGLSDTMSGVYRKQVDIGTEDMVIARFWVQNFQLLTKTTYDEMTSQKLQKVLRQLAEDMLSLRSDIMDYAKEVARYFEGIKSGGFYEKKGNIEYFKEVFHGKKLVENFYFHAELCKRDALRFLKLAIPHKSSWQEFYEYSDTNPHLKRLFFQLQHHWENLLSIKAIRGVIEHGDEEKDFEITEIELKETEKGTAFIQPYFLYPEQLEIKVLDGSKKIIPLKDVTVVDLMDKHFWAIFNVCEDCVVYPLIEKLDTKWQPKKISLQSMDVKCPIQWDVEPATTPRRTVNHPPV